MQPTTSLYPDTSHAAEDDQERAWLDDWMRGRVCTRSLEVCPALEPATAPARPLATAGSH